MENTKEIAVFKGQVSKLENQVIELTIASPQEQSRATELLAKLKETDKAVKSRKEEITKPLNAALKSARELFAPLEDKLEAVKSALGRKVIDYKQKVEAEARKKEAEIAAKVEAGKMKIETAEKKIEKIERVENTVHTDHGRVQFRKIKKVRVTSEALVPDQYWVIDMVAVRKDALAGIKIEGCEVYEEEIV